MARGFLFNRFFVLFRDRGAEVEEVEESEAWVPWLEALSPRKEESPLGLLEPQEAGVESGAEWSARQGQWGSPQEVVPVAPQESYRKASEQPLVPMKLAESARQKASPRESEWWHQELGLCHQGMTVLRAETE